MHTARRIVALTLSFAILVLGGCIPLAVGSTARPAEVGERQLTTSVFVVPNGVSLRESSKSASQFGVDAEARSGLSDRSDLGLRFTSVSGVVASYKRRLNGFTSDPGFATAVMVGGGLVNFGLHAEVEGSLMISASGDGNVTPYGGLRVVQVVPISSAAVHDTPTAGGYMGARFGRADFGFSTELGVFYDHSALGLRKQNFIVVPSISLHGNAGSILRRLTLGR